MTCERDDWLLGDLLEPDFVFIACERMDRTVEDGEVDAGFFLQLKFVSELGFLATVVKGLKGELEQLGVDCFLVSCWDMGVNF